MGYRDLFQRACQAHHRQCNAEGAIIQQPSSSASGFEMIDGEDLFVLRNVDGPLAAFHISPTWRILGQAARPAE
jgi:hypothetical protein